MKFGLSIGLLSLVFFGGCKNPQAEYFKQIENNGFIPFKQPMGNVRTGSILRGTPNQLFPMAPPTSCFPDVVEGMDTELRWESDATLAQTHFSSRLAFDATLNTIASMGTPSVTFKFDMEKITKVDFEAEEVSVEMFDHFKLQDFYQNEMSDLCREHLSTKPFIVNALQTKRMTFTFLDVFGGKIQLDMDNIQEIVDIEVNASWHIENGYRLVITSPKFIGYHLAQFRPQDNGMLNFLSTKADFEADLFQWIDLNAPLDP